MIIFEFYNTTLEDVYFKDAFREKVSRASKAIYLGGYFIYLGGYLPLSLYSISISISLSLLAHTPRKGPRENIPSASKSGRDLTKNRINWTLVLNSQLGENRCCYLSHPALAAQADKDTYEGVWTLSCRSKPSKVQFLDHLHWDLPGALPNTDNPHSLNQTLSEWGLGICIFTNTRKAVRTEKRKKTQRK